MSKLGLISWDVYEIQAEKTELHGVMLRGRIRKLGLEDGFNVLCENATDAGNRVRFAMPTGENPEKLIAYLRRIMPDVRVDLVATAIQNPVLSKLQVNQEERYTL